MDGVGGGQDRASARSGEADGAGAAVALLELLAAAARTGGVARHLGGDRLPNISLRLRGWAGRLRGGLHARHGDLASLLAHLLRLGAARFLLLHRFHVEHVTSEVLLSLIHLSE